ncbi:phpC [Symbiodinium sp. CCMP2456]|nr:phpC [Symbiodinium sp. CCMP2456]
MALHDSSPREIATKGLAFPQGTLPLIAIPTTAGTGSEATHFAVVYVDGEKYSVADPCLLPETAIVDPKLTYSVPTRMTAATGLDAFCQAIESIWAVGATEESVGYAKEAAALAFAHLPTATNSPTEEARYAMCRASHLAGKAINISKTTLPHAISYAITADYGIPHGAAVATTLSSVLAYNFGVTSSDCADTRGAPHVHQRLSMILEILGAATIAEACQRVESFVSSLGCNPTLVSAGIHQHEKIRTLAERVNPERLSNNPRKANHEDLFSLLSGKNREWQLAKGTAWTEADVTQLYDEFVPFQLDAIRQNSQLVPGLASTVDALKAQDIKIGATTGYFRAAADLVTEVGLPLG